MQTGQMNLPYKVSVVLSLCTPQGSALRLGGLVLFMSHPPMLPPGSCLITCLGGIRGVSHARGGKSFLLIYSERSAASLTTVH